MKVCHALTQFADKETPVVLAAGCFDGLHIGHRAVIQVAINHAREIGGEAWIFTFDPHPAKVLSPEHAPPMVYTTEQQLRCLQEMKVDGCILQPFTREFMGQMPEEFFDSLIANIPALAGVSVGEDWSFGKKRSGTAETMRGFCAEKNIFFSAHQEVCYHDQRISSTRIRKAIELGELDAAQNMLGSPVRIIGQVVHGEKIGRKLGYPTANIDPENDMLPPRGIYAAELRVGHSKLPAAAYIGHRETFHENKPQVLEVHLLDHDEGIDLYDQHVEVGFIEYIRGDAIFEDAEALKAQIADDLSKIRNVLKI